MNIESIIESLRGSDRYIETIFTQGGCYQFHLFLKSIYSSAMPFLTEDKEHVVTLVNGNFYDITGNVDHEQNYTAMNKDDIETAKEWSFSKTAMLQLGECAICEEPRLV